MRKKLAALAALTASSLLLLPAATAEAHRPPPSFGPCSNDVLHVTPHWTKKHVRLTIRLRTTCLIDGVSHTWDHNTTRWVF